MKKPPDKFPTILIVLLVIAGVFWIITGPRPALHMQPPVRVQVEPPPPPPEPSPSPPEPQPQTQVQPEAPLPPTGDEKAEAQVATIMPLPSAPDIKPGTVMHPRIAIVLDDLGLDIRGTRRAIGLPDFVTLSFMPYATRLRDQVKEGHDAGHELMLHMPMEPMGHEDPGPGALLTNLPQSELQRRLETALASFTGFDGVNNHMGSKFTADPAGMEFVIGELQERHLFFLDSRTSAKSVGEAIARLHGVPTVSRDVFLDDDLAIGAIRNQIEQAERIARRKGTAVVIGHPHATTLEALETWLPDAQARGFVFVPVRDLVK